MVGERVEENLRLEGFEDVSGLLHAGVYALVAKQVVIYVGKSKALLPRVYTHRQNYINKRKGKVPEWLTPVKGMFFDELFVRPCRIEELDALEREMIERYKPRYNQLLKTQELVTCPVPLQIGGVVLTLNAKPATLGIERRI